MEYPLTLYFENDVQECEILDLSRGDDDFRKVYIASDGQRKIVIKQFSNTFSGRHRIEGWFRLMEEYRRTGLYCPPIVPNRSGERIHCDPSGLYVIAEEFAPYETAEHLEKAGCRQNDFMPDVLRSLGKIAALHLDILDWPSCYCLLEPFCAPDTTDEATECAIAFVDSVKKNLPQYLPRAEALLDLFYRLQDDLRSVYHTLPASCFQADLNDSNILLNENGTFVGLIDFNLCGREPVLNYAVREALWAVSDSRLFAQDDDNHCLYYYSRELDDIRICEFLKNIGYVQEYYTFSDAERKVFPLLFRYMNSFWWGPLHALERVRNEPEKITLLLDWLERQMTRDDIRLP